MVPETSQEISHGSKVKKGKEAEQLLEGRAAMIRRAKDTADGFDMQPFSFAKTASAVEAELESSPEKSAALGWDASSEARLDLDNMSVADAAHPGGGKVGAAGEGDAAQGSDEKDEHGKKNKTRDVGRFRVSSFEKQRRAVTNIKTEAANALQTSGESLEEHESKNDQFGHFIAIVRVRRALLEALTKKTNKDFMQHVEDLNAKSLSLQPVPRAVLVRTHVLEQLEGALERIMQKETKEEIETLCTCLSQQCAIHVQLRNSLKNSTRDLENAIKADAKKKERDAEAAAKKAAKRKQTADAASAAATRKAATKDSQKGVTILSTFSEKLKFTWFPRFADLAKFKAKLAEAMESKAAGEDPTALKPLVAAAAKVATGSMPFVISNMADIEKLVKESPTLRCMVTNFGHQFPGTQLCKVTGRAQCPCKKDESTAQLLKMMLEAIPFRKADAVVKQPAYQDLEGMVFQASLFGFTAEMSYVGFEERGLGQLRYVLQGSRRVITASPRAVQERLGGQGDAPSSATDMINFWKFIDLAKLTDCSSCMRGIRMPGPSCTSRRGGCWPRRSRTARRLWASGSASCQRVKMNA